jgi:hypothetical protein
MCCTSNICQHGFGMDSVQILLAGRIHTVSISLNFRLQWALHATNKAIILNDDHCLRMTLQENAKFRPMLGREISFLSEIIRSNR